VLLPLYTVAQQLNLPISNDFQTRYYKQLYDTSNTSFTGIQPYVESFVNYDATYVPPFRTSYSPFEKKLTRDNLIALGNDSVTLKIDPLFYFEKGNSKTTPKISRNTRGFWLKGNIGKQFSFESSFIENQSFTTPYIDNFVTAYKVFPGMGRTKEFKETGYDYAMASGYLSYTPQKNINIQFGHGKLFIGNGYRSLLLSDNSFNYPHLKTTYQYKKIQYTWVVASLMNVRNPISLSPFSEPLLRKKKASFHYLSYKPNKLFEVSLFQGVIYNTETTKYDWNALNPVILSQSIMYGFNSKNNVLLGINFNVKVNKNILAYAQLMCNDLSLQLKSFNNKSGAQLGVYYQNFLGAKNLNLRLEYNSVRPFTYQKINPYTSFTQYSQSLTHPLNANFKELVLIGDYNFDNFIMRVKIIGAVVGKNTNTINAGNNLLTGTNFNSQTLDKNNVEMLMGNIQNILVQDYSVGYLINPYNNFTLRIGYFNRSQSGLINNHYTYFSLSAFIFNQYLDF